MTRHDISKSNNDIFFHLFIPKILDYLFRVGGGVRGTPMENKWLKLQLVYWSIARCNLIGSRKLRVDWLVYT